MPAVRHTFRSQNHRGSLRPESKPLVVAISVLQLALIAFVWLLALVPMALVALGATVFQAMKPTSVKTPSTAGS